MSIPPLVVDIQDLTIRFGAVEAVKSVTIQVGAGRIMGLVGESGSGKSTLANAIIGLLPPAANIAQGSMKFDGRDLLSLSNKDWQALRGQDVSYVSQDPMSALNPALRIGEQMLDIQHWSDKSRSEKLATALDALQKVKMPQAEARLGMYPHELSGGQRQRVCIAMAIMARPKLLIADEATTALDATLEVEIVELLQALQHKIGCAMLFVTHHLTVVEELCDDVTVMYHGDVRESGTVPDVFSNPADDYTRNLLSCDPSRIEEKCRRLPIMSNLDLKSLANPENDRARIDHKSKPLLSIRHLDVTFRKPRSIGDLLSGTPERRVDAVQNASLDIAPGETVALIGESGSGKSTLARAVMRLVPAQRGEIVFDDTDLLSISQREMRPFRNEMSMMLQDPIGSLSPRMPVGTSVIEPIIVSGSSRGKNLRHEAIKLLEMVGLSEDFADRYPHEMSGGQARRVGVARALALRPKLVIADEPTAGLDVSIQGEIFNLLAELRETMSLSILIITHNLHVVRHLADRMVIMYHGEIVETGLTEDVVRAPQHNYTRELLAANLHAKYGTNS
ncbi:MAG: ABC transporter ATP-binding protein [Hyphomicrobiales bacterium]